eukprot:3990121-Ditylum_brightwellii.AAC.1
MHKEVCWRDFTIGTAFCYGAKKSVADVLKDNKTEVSAFIRLTVGEGTHKEEGMSFAEEVAAMAGKS